MGSRNQTALKKTRKTGALDFREWMDERIKELSIQHGKKLKQTAIAREAGISPEYLSRILISPKFTVRPDLDVTIAIGMALGDPGAALEAAYGKVPGVLRGEEGPSLAILINSMPPCARTNLRAFLEAQAAALSIEGVEP